MKLNPLIVIAAAKLQLLVVLLLAYGVVKAADEIQYPKSVLDAQAKLQVQIDKAKSEYSKLLDKCAQEEAKKGNLELAGEIKKLQKTILIELAVDPSRQGSDPMINCIGDWSYPHGKISIDKDYSCHHSSGFIAKLSLLKGENKIQIAWNNGAVDWMEIVDGKEATAKGGSTVGSTWNWTRAPNKK